ncbi:hypothetical protein SAMN02927924_00891 [Sphingobium faniae]|nr:hypothetical protein SAMN02927924_00891 [Sphingobium faniae]
MIVMRPAWVLLLRGQAMGAERCVFAAEANEKFGRSKIRLNPSFTPLR